MAAPISPAMLARLVPGHAIKEKPVEQITHPLANAAFLGALVVAVLAMVQTWKERRRG